MVGSGCSNEPRVVFNASSLYHQHKVNDVMKCPNSPTLGAIKLKLCFFIFIHLAQSMDFTVRLLKVPLFMFLMVYRWTRSTSAYVKGKTRSPYASSKSLLLPIHYECNMTQIKPYIVGGS